MRRRCLCGVLVLSCVLALAGCKKDEPTTVGGLSDNTVDTVVQETVSTDTVTTTDGEEVEISVDASDDETVEEAVDEIFHADEGGDTSDFKVGTRMGISGTGGFIVVDGVGIYADLGAIMTPKGTPTTGVLEEDTDLDGRADVSTAVVNYVSVGDAFYGAYLQGFVGGTNSALFKDYCSNKKGSIEVGGFKFDLYGNKYDAVAYCADLDCMIVFNTMPLDDSVEADAAYKNLEYFMENFVFGVDMNK